MSISFNIQAPVTSEDIENAMALLEMLHPSSSNDVPAPKQATPSPVQTGGNSAQDNDETAVETEFDAEGLPWDSRIHSRNKTIVKSTGLWKLARGVDEKLVDEVKAELRARVASSATPNSDAPTPEKTTALSEPPAPAAPPAPPAPPAPSVPVTETRYIHGDETFSREQLEAAGWNDDQINSLDTIEVPIAASSTPASETKVVNLTFAEVAKRIQERGIDQTELNNTVLEVATAKGRPEISRFALLATPANADILADLAARLWPEG